jgi:type I restriction enzyme R subunit
MKMLVKRLLKKYKYPPEDEEEAVNAIISQRENVD